jgi:hypothetical protein
MMSHEGPTEESRKNATFEVKFRGEGWSDKVAEGTDQHSGPPDTVLITKVNLLDFYCRGKNHALKRHPILLPLRTYSYHQV